MEREGSEKVSTPGLAASSRHSGRVNLEAQEEGEEQEDEAQGERIEAEDEEEAAMQAMMGFGGFDSTKVRTLIILPLFQLMID